MQVEKSERFVKAADVKGTNGITFKILEEPLEVQGTYGKKLETRVLMKKPDGSESARARWSIGSKNKDTLIDAYGRETADWIGKEFAIHVEQINGKDSIMIDQEQF